ncbi:hypothetical protein LWI29_008298 [Acer saccharum]|uniref:PGG domain-containing protein n=1 Tax=Acer saccharum TaxID=4024 RepID=A0AA39SUD8_ACESA|nr:hypothetical protein LWI29_008298 [Acer saccharum]
MVQQPESGGVQVQPNVSPSSQQQAESGGVQVQPNVSPSSQQQTESGGVQIQPNVSPSLQQPAESGGVKVQPNVSPSLQQQAKSGGEIQPNVSPSLQQPAESGGVQVQPNANPSLKKPAESIDFFLRPPKSINELPAGNLGESAHQPPLSEAEIAAVEFSPTIKIVRDTKLKNKCAVELVHHVCKRLSSMSFHQIFDFIQSPRSIMGVAVKRGNEEVVRTLLHYFPDLTYIEAMPQRNILQVAIEYRQEKIVNIIKDIYPAAVSTNLCAFMMASENTTLHLAGKLAPPFKLLSVSGAALQMQRELQWFKEVEKIIKYPFLRDMENEKKETAYDVFRTAHEDLAKKGEKWMKDTANSCMLVATLIATVLFAAAFTVPGGNNDNGIPIFLRTDAFAVFAISAALGLFSSLTSLLNFLSILTARYTQEDFLKSLPTKLIIGLGSLFFAIAAMIIAFGATLTVVLSKNWHWVSVPITLLATFPVAIFVMLQLPLFIQMVWSTYGSGMFHP